MCVADADTVSSCRERIAVIIPTLNEVGNIDAVIQTVLLQNTQADVTFEILVADGGSTDGTREKVEDWQSRAPVRLIKPLQQSGLAGDVLEAAAQATASIVVVMDADLSHPPASLAGLVQPLLRGEAGMAIGSRYVRGGATVQWPLWRQILSRAGGLLAWPIIDVRDPMSGFFAVRRDRLLSVHQGAAGFKIGLEIMAAAGDDMRVVEVPITFTDRTVGQSKIGGKQVLDYLSRLIVLAGGALSLQTAAKFAAVGFAGMILDGLITQTALDHSAGIFLANVLGFGCATLFNYYLNSHWSFSSAEIQHNTTRDQLSRYILICMLALCLRGGIIATASEIWGIAKPAALWLGVITAAVVSYLGSAFYVFPAVEGSLARSIHWRVAACGIFLYAFLLRLWFIGPLDLWPEEAYYWNYAQHLDFGYLDHPPMVAWLIGLSTRIFGDSEFGVRFPAILAGAATAFISYRFARNLYGKTEALIALALVSVLPYFFFTGMLMTPDTPLMTCWAAALYFLERALFGGNREAWYAAGAALGLGFLSKYTIVLVGAATLVFLIIDKPSRRWFTRVEPYAAAAIAAVLSLPVVIWNVQHEWASFAFQSTRRLSAGHHFSLPNLIGSIFVLLSPPGVWAAFTAMSAAARKDGGTWHLSSDRRTVFAAVYTLVPLSVFVVFSLMHSVKLNWTGPLWFALVPLLAHRIAVAASGESANEMRVRRVWGPAMLGLLLLHGGLLNFTNGSFPGATTFAVGDLRIVPGGWKALGLRVDEIEQAVRNDTGEEPLIVGMDRYFISSELAFYDPDRAGANDVGGTGLFGGRSLMYDYWVHPGDQSRNNIVLVSLKPDQIEGRSLLCFFETLDPVKKETLYSDGQAIGHFFYRVGYGYKTLPASGCVQPDNDGTSPLPQSASLSSSTAD